MNKEKLKKFKREEKIKIYIETEDEIQKIWWNPKFLLRDWFFDEISDEQIENHIIENISQLKLERFFIYWKWIFYFIIWSFVLLWIIWLLLFWIKQLFWN